MGPYEGEQRLHEVTSSRVRLVERFEADKRRIERDLHDGAQQRLLTLSLRLGMARQLLSPAEGELRELIEGAHEESKLVLQELRDLVQGIHPRVLTDRGIAAAIAELAGTSVVPVKTALGPLASGLRFADPVESAVYFTFSEALANANRHSQAELIVVEAGHDGERLTVTIRDDGVGGAESAVGGTGLQGLADRADILGGRLLVSSPPGGPTELRLEVPCRPCAS
ncbi:sensor histidine kinase [Nonomuraea jiangxiensis]|nr:histidine kinase [Nonomuraea jiangxiensis]